MMETVRIAAVSYLNTFPFVFGIKTSGELDDIELDAAVPRVCAERLMEGKADLALVPVGAIPEIEGAKIVTDYCIGAEGDVKTVLLLSHVPLEEIKTIHLDYDSRSSVALARILARDYWKINPSWEPLPPDKAGRPDGIESLVAIGDKTFYLTPHFPYIYDLAGEWYKHTGLPFVFAAWITRKELPEAFIAKFNKALGYGISHIQDIPDFFKSQIPKGVDVIRYYEENISYHLDDKKHRGMNLFLDLWKEGNRHQA